MKKLIALILIFALTFTLYVPMATAATVEFPDVEVSRWSYPYISMLSGMGIVTGNDDGTFAPTRTVTNGEFITLLIRASSGEPADVYDAPHWAQKYINAAFSAGIVLDGELTPDIYDAAITRQSMARMIMRTLKEPDESATLTQQLTSKVKDWAEVCEDCKPFVAQAYAKGIILGSDGNFFGGRSATREEATTIIVRMIDKSYRYSFYDGIPFCAKTDVTDDGLMKLSAAKRFIDKTIDTLRFYKEGDKYFFTVTLPEVPDGFKMGFSVNMDPGIGYTTNWYLPERAIPDIGTITKELPYKYMAQVLQKGDILTGIWVATKTDIPLQIRADGDVGLLAVYSNGKLEKFSSALVVTNGAASKKSATDMNLNYSDYFKY